MQKNAEEIKSWLQNHIAREAQMAPEEIKTDEGFTIYGLSSRQLVRLAGDLEKYLGRKLPPSLAYEYPDIESLAEDLEKGVV